MKRYRFRLEQVQRVRRVQEDLTAVALVAARRAEAATILAVQERRAALAARARPSGVIPATGLQADQTVWSAGLAALDAADAERLRAADAVAVERDRWLLASRRVRALELLDERRREEHRIAADREDAKRVDDLVAGRRALRPGVLR